MIPPFDIRVHQVPLILDVIAALAWAVSGALVARSKGFDFAGVFIMALIATTGGGLIRDGIFLQRIPAMVTNPLYLVAAFVAALTISAFGGRWERVRWADTSINVIDALGTPSYALIGFQLAYLSGLAVWGALLIGVVNGVAGGILRDVLVGDAVRVLRPGQYVAGILLGALALYVALMAGVRASSEAAAWIAIVVAMAARMLVIRYNWRSQPVKEWAVDQKLTQLPAHVKEELRSVVLKQEQPGTPAEQDE
jgi:uncharacterized membrane protein YeiH